MKPLLLLLSKPGYTIIFNITIILYPVGSKATFVVFNKMDGDCGAQVRRVLFVVVAHDGLAAFTVGYFSSLLDPPKVIADIVESLIGAIYMDGGLEAGMEAARTLLKPVLDVILMHGEYIDLVHPKKKLQELVGELLVVETTWEDNFHQNIPLLDGSQLRFADPYGTQGIGYVRFMDTILVAVSDSSRAVARNKACAIIVQVLISDLNLLKRLQNLRYLVESAATARSSDEQVKIDI